VPRGAAIVLVLPFALPAGCGNDHSVFSPLKRSLRLFPVAGA
jgi:hypothetical protein